MRGKRFLAGLLSAVMLTAMLPVQALANEEEMPETVDVRLGAFHITEPEVENNAYRGEYSFVWFGNYKQSSDGNGGYNVDPIKWRVLENDSEDNELFLLSDQNLDVVKYHETLQEQVTWATSTIRSWLNGLADSENLEGNDYQNKNFLNTAFSAEEQGAIATTNVINKDNELYGTEGGDNTWDKIFLLSIEEAENEKYFPKGKGSGDQSRIGNNTAYTYSQGGNNEAGKGDYWWLRSPGKVAGKAADVLPSGLINEGGVEVDFNIQQNPNATKVTVRPAFRLDLDAVLFTSAATNQSAPDSANGLQQVSSTNGKEWKVTVEDEKRTENFSFSIASEGEDTLTVIYSGAQMGENEFISAYVVKNGEITHYGRLAKVEDDGAGELTINTASLDGGELYLFNEQCNGGRMTNYASNPQAVPAEDDVNTVTLHTNGGKINKGNVTSYITGVGATLPTDVTRDGYTFGGWYEEQDFSGKKVEKIPAETTGDKTYYARWVQNSAVTVSISGGASGNGDDFAAAYGSTVTFIATIGSLPIALAAENTVEFFVGDTTLGTAAVNENTATLPDVSLTGETWQPSATPYTITAVYGGSTALYGNRDTAKLTVNKAEQSAQPTIQSAVGSYENAVHKITVSAAGSGTGGIEYACVKGGDAAVPKDGWQSGGAFSDGLTAGTAYTVFARFAGDTYTAPSAPVSRTVYTLPVIKNDSLRKGWVGVSYQDTLSADQGEGVSLVWSSADLTEKTGLNISKGGVISGTPAKTNSDDVEFAVTIEGTEVKYTVSLPLIVEKRTPTTEDNTLQVSNGTQSTTSFTYGDTIHVSGTIAASDAAVPANDMTAPAENQVALFLRKGENDTQLTEAKSVESDGTFALAYNTAEKYMAIGNNMTLVVKYGGSDTLKNGEIKVSDAISLVRKPVTAKPTDEVTKPYDGNNKATVTLGFDDDAILENDSVTVSARDAVYASADAGDGIVIDLGDLSVNGDTDWYAVSATGEQITGSITAVHVKTPTIDISGGTQIGNTLRAVYTPGSGEQVNYRWNRDDAEIPGETNETYQIRAEDIGRKITVTVSAKAEDRNHTGTATSAAVTPGKQSQNPPSAPTVRVVTTSSIEVNQIAPNETSGAVVEYSIDGGTTWQTERLFSGLSAGRTYQIVARYRETEGYHASAASQALQVTTQSGSGSSGSNTRPSGSSSSGNSGTTIIEDEDVPLSDGWINPFIDVHEEDWFFENVKYVHQRRMMNGTSANTFTPNGASTRAMLWTILARMDGETISGADWVEQARTWAVGTGVSDGTNPNNAVTREQLVTMLYRYAQMKGKDVSVGEDTNILSYADAGKISEYAVSAMQWAVGAGIVNGVTADTIAPQAGATRAQMAAMLQRFAEL